MMLDSIGTVNRLLSNPVIVPSNMELKNREVFLRFNNNNEIVEVNELLSFYPNPYIPYKPNENKYYPPKHMTHLQSFPSRLLQTKDVRLEANKISYLDFMKSTDATNELQSSNIVPRLPDTPKVPQITNVNNENLDEVPTLRDILKDAPRKAAPAFSNKSAKVNTNYFAKTSLSSPKQQWKKPPSVTESESYLRAADSESKIPLTMNYFDRTSSPLLRQRLSKPPSVNERTSYLRMADTESKKPGYRSPASPVSSFGSRTPPRSSVKPPVAPPLPGADKVDQSKTAGQRPLASPYRSVRSSITPRSSPKPPVAPPLPGGSETFSTNLTSLGSESSYSKLNLKGQTYPRTNTPQTYNALSDDKPVTMRTSRTSTKARGTSGSSGIVRTGKIWKPPTNTAYPPRDQLHAELLKVRPPIPPAAE